MTQGVTGLSLLDPFTSRYQLISSRDQVYNLPLLIEEILLSSFSPRREVKACVSYFYQIFIFSANDSPSKTVKNVFYFI